MHLRTSTKRLALFGAILAIAGIFIGAGFTVRSQKEDPTSKAPTGPAPSRVLATKDRKIPVIATAGTDVKATVLRFIDFAGNAGGDQKEEIRRSLEGLRQNSAAIEVMCDEAFSAQKSDHSRALLILSLLGEARDPDGAKCLARFMKLPFPKTGTTVDGEIVEQTALGTLQAKAIDGLAYLKGKETNAIVLDAIKSHPSIIVRAEAIEAYLWNNRDNEAEARRAVSGVIRRGEEIYLDRVRRDTGESAQSFNQKLEAFLRKHPEAVGAKPEPDKDTQKPKDERPGRLPAPPKF